MKYFYIILLAFISCFLSAQNFSSDEYQDFRESVKGLSPQQLEDMHARPAQFYLKGFEPAINFSNATYLDSVKLKLEITPDELELLNENLFFVTERLKYQNFGQAFHNIYNFDLPVFITTDAILHALHMSYDQILKNLEREIMSYNLEEFLKSVYDNFSVLEQKYDEIDELADGLKDADIYVTIAYSLISDKLQPGHIADSGKLNEIWTAINDEKLVSIPLFTFPERNRNLDFSQFTVRGHYVFTEQEMWMGFKSLEPYFRAMMWLGRTDFLLTPPPENPWELPWTEKEILRMNIGAFMVNELVQRSENLSLLQFNEQVINYLVGESDNITPAAYQSILDYVGLNSAEQLLNSTNFKNLSERLNSNPELGQKILSDFFLMDPQGDKPGVLPISYRVSGQRFIIDSYILGNVVFDRLMFDRQKVMRMMPKPLDVIFTLGNNDVLPLLKDDFEKYPYAEQLSNLRYLIDDKSEEFWSGSLYNVWLNSIRELNPAEQSGLPLFMKTAAWHQEKINTQLASWSQLRHDNLLYAKQSYTGGTGCSFPYSYIEPYPEFYARLTQFALDAGNFFSQLPSGNFEVNRIKQFFPQFAQVTGKLEILAQKQLDNIPFSAEENDWLKSMLFAEGGSGIPPYSGWYTDLFYDKWDAAEGDFTIVDVHTQPTDEAGNIVGKVLHTGVGEVNLGVFLTNCPGVNNELMAFVGPVMSYYESITDNFKRMTDQEWEESVMQNHIPERPGWTNIYLADEKGKMKEKSVELPSKLYTNTINISVKETKVTAYPNPVSEVLNISFNAKENEEAEIAVFNSNGVLIRQMQIQYLKSETNKVEVPFYGLPEGLYIVKVALQNGHSTALKIIKK